MEYHSNAMDLCDDTFVSVLSHQADKSSISNGGHSYTFSNRIQMNQMRVNNRGLRKDVLDFFLWFMFHSCIVQSEKVVTMIQQDQMTVDVLYLLMIPKNQGNIPKTQLLRVKLGESIRSRSCNEPKEYMRSSMINNWNY